MRVVLSLFRKTVAQPCKPLHRHAHGEILSLDGGNWIRNSSSVPPSVVSRVAEFRNKDRGDGSHRSSFRLTAGGRRIRTIGSRKPARSSTRPPICAQSARGEKAEKQGLQIPPGGCAIGRRSFFNSKRVRCSHFPTGDFAGDAFP